MKLHGSFLEAYTVQTRHWIYISMKSKIIHKHILRDKQVGQKLGKKAIT